MKIADLQPFLRNLGSFLASNGGSQPAKDFERFAECLEPFRALAIAELADFLQRADQFAKDGIVPVKAGRARTPCAPARSSEEVVKDALQKINALYEKARDPDFRYETVETELAGIKKLTVAQLTSVSREFGIASVHRKKDDIIAEIGRKIKGLREFLDRSQMSRAP